jgi:translocon-associated protein (TRAP) beta subunit
LKKKVKNNIKKSHLLATTIVILILSNFPQLMPPLTHNPIKNTQSPLNSASPIEYNEELYVEQISADIFANGTLIHNAIFGDKPNIIDEMDWQETLFNGVSLILIQQNGPNPYSSVLESSLNSIGPIFQDIYMFGIVSIDKNKIPSGHQGIYTRVFERLELYLKLDLIEFNCVENSDLSLISFIGYPAISNLSEIENFKKIISNIPRDGIFQNLEHTLNHIYSSPTNFKSRFQSQSLYILDSWNQLQCIQKLLIENSFLRNSSFFYDYYHHALQNPIFDTIEDLINQEQDIEKYSIDLNANSDNVVASNIEIPELFDLVEIRNFLTNLTDLVFYDYIYEGFSEGINTNNNSINETGVNSLNQFDFFKAMKWDTQKLIKPKDSIIFSPMGWLSGLSISLHQGEILDISPKKFNISSNNLLTLDYLLFLNEEHYSTIELRDYLLKNCFQSQNSKQKLMMFPEKFQNYAHDDSELLSYLIPFGIPVISALFIDKIPNIKLNYTSTCRLPALTVLKCLEGGNLYTKEKNLGNLSVNYNNNENATLQFQIEIKNNGNADAWGVPFNLAESYGLSNRIPVHPISGALTTLGYKLEDIFHQDLPRYFPIDPFGQSKYVGYFPNIFDLKLYVPYSSQFCALIYENILQIENITYLSRNDIYNFANQYNKSYSIYNPENWVIHPNDSISLNFTQFIHQTPPKSTNFSYEILASSSVRYSTEGGLQIHTASSNSILIDKLSYNDTNSNFTNSKVNVTHATTLISENYLSSNLKSNQDPILNLNFSIIHSGNTPISNSTFEIPYLGLMDNNFQGYLKETTIKGMKLTKLLSTIPANSTLENITVNSSKLYLRYKFQPNLILDATQNYFVWQNGYVNTTSLAIKCQSIVYSTNGESFQSNSPQYVSKVKIEQKTMPQINSAIGSIYNISLIYQISNVGKNTLFNYSINLETNSSIHKGLSLVSITILNTTTATFQPGEQITYNITFLIDLNQTTFLAPIFPIFAENWNSIISGDLITILSYPKISITRRISQVYLLENEILLIKFHVTNLGRLPIFNLFIDDTNSYEISDFELSSGTLINTINVIQPNETIEFSYSLLIKGIGNSVISPSKLIYNYVVSQEILTGSTELFIFPSIQNISIGISIIIVSILAIILYRKKKKSKTSIEIEKDLSKNPKGII